VGVGYTGTAHIFEYPYFLINGLQIWQVYSVGPSEQKPFKIWEKMEHGRI